MNCKHCNRKFKKTDEIVSSKINGTAFVHVECHIEWLLRWDGAEYLTYEEAIGEFEEN